jgi:hypothetical protein
MDESDLTEDGCEEKHAKKAERSYLQRLESAAYQGIAEVHWALTIDGRKRGWLDQEFHFRFRELLVHVGCRWGSVVRCSASCRIIFTFFGSAGARVLINVWL